jgi:hypothetical protein
MDEQPTPETEAPDEAKTNMEWYVHKVQSNREK